MKIKDLIYMDRQPFNRNTAIDMQERYRKPDYHRVLLSLYFQYYNKFSEVMGVDLYMPQLSLWIGTDDLQDDRDIREAGGKLQYQKVMQWPGWESFSVQSDNVWETEHLFRKFPGLRDTIHGKYKNIRFQLHGFSNYRLGKYLTYKANHQEEINQRFYQEDQVIESALAVVNDPIQDTNKKIFTTLMPDGYFVAFITVPLFQDNCFGNLQFHFAINMFVIDKLLDAANKIFNLEEGHENGFVGTC